MKVSLATTIVPHLNHLLDVKALPELWNRKKTSNDSKHTWRGTICCVYQSVIKWLSNMKNYTWKHAIILHIYKLWTIHLPFLKRLITPFTTSCVIECSRSNLKVSTQKIHTSGKRERERERERERTYSFSKGICELPFVGSVLYDWDHKLIIITMSLNSFYHFHMSDL